MSAMLAADYRDNTFEALDALRKVLESRRDQARIVAEQCNKDHDWYGFEKAFGMVCAYGTAIDDVAMAIITEMRR